MARNDKRIDQLTPSTIPLVGTDLFAIYNANGTRNDSLTSLTQYMGENIVVTGITANDTYVTGGTLNVNSLELGRNQGLSDISVDLSPLITANDTYVTGATLNSNTLEIGRNQGLTTLSVDLSSTNTNTIYTGTTNYISKYDVTGLTESQIQDDGARIGIGTGLSSTSHVNSYTNTYQYGIKVRNDKASTHNVGIFSQSFGASDWSIGLKGQASFQATYHNTGVEGRAGGSPNEVADYFTNGETIGGFFAGGGSSAVDAYGIVAYAGDALNNTTETNTAGLFIATGGTSNYALRLVDGTQGTIGDVWTSLDVDGNGAWVTPSSFTGNTSGSCITDLYVSNIHSCSPLNINPNNEGDVLVGSGGFTFDVVNTRFGIGKSPQYIFDMLGSGFRTYMSDTNDVKKLLISGGTDTLCEFSTVIDYPSLGGLGGISVGTIGPNAVVAGIVPERGQQGDTYIYSSAKANGLNLISADNPSGAEDYIRLYAGQDATSTPDIHIQGSGTTRGYVGLNNNNPQELLDVSGNAVISGNLEIQGQANNPFFTGTTSTTYTPNWDESGFQKLELTGSVNVSGGTSTMKDGATYTLMIVQGVGGSHTITWDGTYKWSSGTAPTLTTAVGSVDIITFLSDGTSLYGLSAPNFL